MHISVSIESITYTHKKINQWKERPFFYTKYLQNLHA